MFQVIQVADFTGGMPGQGQCQIIPVNTVAVIADTNQLDAALLDINLDFRGIGINTVFQQFLHHRGRPLNHLAGGDLVNKLVGHLLNSLGHKLSGIRSGG